MFVGHFCPPGSGSGSTKPINLDPDPQHCYKVMRFRNPGCDPWISGFSSIYSFFIADILQGCGGVAGLLAVPDPGPGTPGVQRSTLLRLTRSHPGQFFSLLLFSVGFFLSEFGRN